MADVRYQSNIPAIIAALQVEAASIVDDSMTAMGRYLLEGFQAPKSGVIYRRAGRDHQASAPGEPPAIDTVDLASKIEPYKETPTRGTMTSYSEHSAVMEYGGKNVAARPFWSVALERTRPGYEARVQAIFANLRIA